MLLSLLFLHRLWIRLQISFEFRCGCCVKFRFQFWMTFEVLLVSYQFFVNKFKIQEGRLSTKQNEPLQPQKQNPSETQIHSFKRPHHTNAAAERQPSRGYCPEQTHTFTIAAATRLFQHATGYVRWWRWSR